MQVRCSRAIILHRLILELTNVEKNWCFTNFLHGALDLIVGEYTEPFDICSESLLPMAGPTVGQMHTPSQTYLSSRGGDYHVGLCIMRNLTVD